MAIELHLQKTAKTPWGFTLAGGVEYEVPLTVIQVAESSIAENAGMQVGDVVVRLNDIPIAGLTHPQAHNVLLSAGDDFILAVRRGDLSHLPPKLLLYETSVENAEDVINVEVQRNEGNENNDIDLNITDEEIANIIGEQVQLATLKAVEKTSIEVSEEINVTHKQSEVSKLVLSEDSQKLDGKKWSTFLQKPRNVKPKAKSPIADGPMAPPYRVIIKKQPKRDPHGSDKSSSKPEEEIDKDTVTEPEQIKVSGDSENTETKTEPLENTDDLNQLDENQNSFVEQDDQNELEEPESRDIHQEQKEGETTEAFNEEGGLNETRISINLEEQLAQVQRQLLALSQLPSAIQQTLNAVTQQLAEIVSVKQVEEQEISIEAKETIQEEITEEYLEVSEEHQEKALSVLHEESETYEEEIAELTTREEEAVRNESEDEQALFEALEREIEEEERRKQDELEAHRIEQERIEKKDKERRASQPLTPLQRPIILPGGRKWAQPDDAVSKIRRPSMTDEKIANTINTFTEVVVGRTMGINFLKYQGPPKNLDYLQKSAVYRLVHDIEPPVKGIVARDIKILAEQDYYTEKHEYQNLSPQMDR